MVELYADKQKDFHFLIDSIAWEKFYEKMQQYLPALYKSNNSFYLTF